MALLQPTLCGPGRDSLLCSELRKAFRERIFIRPPFPWPGKNSVSARRRAASDLGQNIKTAKRLYPSSLHFIIAHSHGGNIVAYAAESLEVRDGVAGFACLSTPFFQAKIRTLDAKMLALGVMLIFATVSVYFPRYALLSAWPTYVSTAIYCVISSVAGLILQRVIGSFDGTARRLARHINAEVAPDVNLRIFRSVGDEASFSLGAAQFCQWISLEVFQKSVEYWTRSLIHLPHGIFTHRPLDKATKITWLFGLPGAAFLAIIMVSLDLIHNTLVGYIIVLLGLALSLNLVYAICSTMLQKTKILQKMVMILMMSVIPGLAIVALLVSSAMTAFWVGTTDYIAWVREVEQGRLRQNLLRRLKDWSVGLSIAMLVEVNTEVSPVGEWVVSQHPRSEDANLAHSAYDNPKVVEAVIRWLVASVNLVSSD